MASSIFWTGAGLVFGFGSLENGNTFLGHCALLCVAGSSGRFAKLATLGAYVAWQCIPVYEETTYPESDRIMMIENTRHWTRDRAEIVEDFADNAQLQADGTVTDLRFFERRWHMLFGKPVHSHRITWKRMSTTIKPPIQPKEDKKVHFAEPEVVDA